MVSLTSSTILKLPKNWDLILFFLKPLFILFVEILDEIHTF